MFVERFSMRFVEIAAADKDESASLEMLAVMKDMQEYVHTHTELHFRQPSIVLHYAAVCLLVCILFVFVCPARG
jgi:hypothetical protein